MNSSDFCWLVIMFRTGTPGDVIVQVATLLHLLLRTSISHSVFLLKELCLAPLRMGHTTVFTLTI